MDLSDEFVSHPLWHYGWKINQMFAVTFNDPKELGFCTWLERCVFRIKAFLKKMAATSKF